MEVVAAANSVVAWAMRSFAAGDLGTVVGLAEHFADMLVADWQQEEMDVGQAGVEGPLKALRLVEAVSALPALTSHEMEWIVA